MRRLLSWLAYRRRLWAAYRRIEASGYRVSPPALARLQRELREP